MRLGLRRADALEASLASGAVRGEAAEAAYHAVPSSCNDCHKRWRDRHPDRIVWSAAGREDGIAARPPDQGAVQDRVRPPSEIPASASIRSEGGEGIAVNSPAKVYSGFDLMDASDAPENAKE
jgi:hypothetical protein